ncbi:hypothetical protein H310_09728 [Aphanomyces invadans]|uniref:Serine protease n=1 Tax=Aphanomyces invadans TaxID=157072 RepID=A0A024TTV0_9STRA|nr:hypothetical protein H310_09728 [Aphanomyces invadans]ETV97394.1 hypothetical protein H310_09728 [Aphanomyces invadans]|eukprot:XP_008874102.1 hypothetical protein H310_09728 [Aphanomyces invadans]
MASITTTLKLNDHNFREWDIYFRGKLMMKGMHQYLTHTPTSASLDATSDDQKALGILIDTLEPSQYRHIAPPTTVSTMRRRRVTGVTVATSAELIYNEEDLDFSLVKLNVKSGVSLASYSYLQARSTGPVLNEPIYIAHHPRSKPKLITSTVDNGVAGTIEGTPTCCPDYVLYSVDTEVGSSGAPVLSAHDNKVVALHSRGGCPNAGVKMDKIVSKLRSLGHLPANAVA